MGIAGERNDDNFVIAVIRKYLTGKTPDEVAKEMRISDKTVIKWVKSAGFVLRPKKYKSRDWDKIKAAIEKEKDDKKSL